MQVVIGTLQGDNLIAVRSLMARREVDRPPKMYAMVKAIVTKSAGATGSMCCDETGRKTDVIWLTSTPPNDLNLADLADLARAR